MSSRSEDDHEEGVDTLRTNWRVGQINAFFCQFSSVLELKPFPMTDIEDILLYQKSDNRDSRLSEVYAKLLSEITGKKVNTESWPKVLLKEVVRRVELGDFDEDHPLVTGTPYDELYPLEKMELLKEVVEWTLESSPLIRNGMKKCGAGDPLIKGQCIGEDKEGNIYWHFEDLSYKSVYLYKEPKSIFTRKKEKKTGRPIESDDGWETLCTSFDEFENLASAFAYSRDKKEKKLNAKLQELFEHLENEKKREERAQRRLQAQAIQLANAMAWGAERSKRQRKQINYAEQEKDLDRMIRESERESRGRPEREERQSRRRETHEVDYYSGPRQRTTRRGVAEGDLSRLTELSSADFYGRNRNEDAMENEDANGNGDAIQGRDAADEKDDVDDEIDGDGEQSASTVLTEPEDDEEYVDDDDDDESYGSGSKRKKRKLEEKQPYVPVHNRSTRAAAEYNGPTSNANIDMQEPEKTSHGDVRDVEGASSAKHAEDLAEVPANPAANVENRTE